MIKRIKQWFINKRDYYANRHVITNMMTPVENKDTAPTPPDERERRPGETYTEYCINRVLSAAEVLTLYESKI